MIQKVQTLQKRLIAKTEEVVEADLLIQEKEKLYVELKNILARQPGPEVAEQLSIYQVSHMSLVPVPMNGQGVRSCRGGHSNTVLHDKCCVNYPLSSRAVVAYCTVLAGCNPQSRQEEPLFCTK